MTHSSYREQIARKLEELRSLLWRSVLWRGGALVLAVVALCVLLSFGVDRLFRLSLTGRTVALAFYMGAILWATWKLLLRPLRLGLSDGALAALIERHLPALEDRLRSAVDFFKTADRTPSTEEEPPRTEEDIPRDGGLSILMQHEVTRQAAEILEGFSEKTVVDGAGLRWNVLKGFGAVAVVIALSLLFQESFGIWFQRTFLFADVDWPYRTHLSVEGFDSGRRGVPRGDPLEVRVETQGEDPVRVTIRLDYEHGDARYNLPREGSGSTFVHQHPAVTEDFTFVVEGGDYRSRPYEVFVQERPTVEEILITVTPPEYTEREPIQSDAGIGELAAPAGSTLALVGRANKPLQRAWLLTENREAELRVEDTSFSGSYLPEAGGSVSVHLEDVEGVPPDRLHQFSVHLIEDRLPAVEIHTSGLGPMITSRARMPLEVRAKDDYKVEKLSLEWTVVAADGARKTSAEDLPELESPGEQVREDPVWEVSPLGIEPEKRLNVRVGATDNNGLTGPRTGYSGILSFLVVSIERLIEEFIRREEEQRRVLEKVVEDEKKTRDSVYGYIAEKWKSDGDLPEEVVQGMMVLARMERQQGRQVIAVAAAVDQILLEMKNNRVGEADDLGRLARLIIDPLRSLGEQSMPTAAVELGKIRDADGPKARLDLAIALATRLESHIATLEEVLANMTRLQSFTEIVKHLRVIMKVQQQSKQATRKDLDADINAIFEPEVEDDADGDD